MKSLKNVEFKMNKLLTSLLNFFIKSIPDTFFQSRNLYRILEKKGFHLIENHYYQPIPDSEDITESLFNKELPLHGIELNLPEQLKMLELFSSKYKTEYDKFLYKGNDFKNFFFDNGFFTTVDAELLYCMVRHNKPENIIEIGSGMSTLISAMAIRKNSQEDPDYKCNLTCIEPYPKEWLRNIPEVTNLVESKVETLHPDTFSILGEKDILFIDSSHIVKIYNDVCFEYLELLPRLNKGVFVHIHDIVLPRVYFKPWYPSYFWNEQYLLLAFLTFNSAYKIIWSANLIHLKHPEKLNEAFTSYGWFKNNIDENKGLQGHKSFWIQRTK